MTSDVMGICADMVLANAIEDLSERKKIKKQKAREQLISSKAYDSLYDFETGLWKEGSDYFLSFYEEQTLTQQR